MENIKIYCEVSEDCDEKGAEGLWDLAGEITLIVGLKILEVNSQNKPLYPEECGQEEVYNRLRNLVVNK